MVDLHQLVTIQLVIFHRYFSNADPIEGFGIKPSEINEFPFIVSIQKRSLGLDPIVGHICGGSLISLIHVLTAGHCIENESIYNIEVLAGSQNLFRAKRYKIRSWMTYEKWASMNDFSDNSKYSDLAVITLANSPKIKPAHIDMKHDEWSTGQVVMAGWGKSNFGTTPLIMEKVSLGIISKKICSKRLLKYRKTVQNQILCTVRQPYAIGKCGDSGNPILINKKTVIAVHRSTAPRRAKECEQINFNVIVSHFKTFIVDVMKMKGCDSCMIL